MFFVFEGNEEGRPLLYGNGGDFGLFALGLCDIIKWGGITVENKPLIRKPTRLKNYDYGSNGAYFITICTQNRKNILSEIISVEEGFPLLKLTEYGKIADKWISELQNRYVNMTVGNYVIMPNHIHLLLTIANNDRRGDPSSTVVSAIGWMKYQITKDINVMRNTTGEKVFQRSFYDHVIRNYEDYCEIAEYIQGNPFRWESDKLYTKGFT